MTVGSELLSVCFHVMYVGAAGVPDRRVEFPVGRVDFVSHRVAVPGKSVHATVGCESCVVRSHDFPRRAVTFPDRSANSPSRSGEECSRVDPEFRWRADFPGRDASNVDVECVLARRVMHGRSRLNFHASAP